LAERHDSKVNDIVRTHKVKKTKQQGLMTGSPPSLKNTSGGFAHDF